MLQFNASATITLEIPHNTVSFLKNASTALLQKGKTLTNEFSSYGTKLSNR